MAQPVERKRCTLLFCEFHKSRTAHFASPVRNPPGTRCQATVCRTTRPLPLRTAHRRPTHLPGLSHPPTMPRPGRTTPLSGMKPRTHGDRKFTPGKANATSGQGKRHTLTRQMPHLNKANATPHTHPSVAFAPTKCDIRDAEVWHFQTISQMTSQMKSANNFLKTNSNNSTKNEKFPSARHRHPWAHQRKSQDHLPPVQRHPRTQRQQIPLHRPGQGRVLLPPLRLQALRAR